MDESSVVRIPVLKNTSGNFTEKEDFLAREEPLEIRIVYGDKDNRTNKSIAVTMRTPGNDEDLATGFLFTEGILREIVVIKEHHQSTENSIVVELKPGAIPQLQKSERNFYTTSSCGICGKSSIDSIRTIAAGSITQDTITIPASLLYSLPGKLRNAQAVFGKTGGLHASALFDLSGNLILVREDVGRHNALDKLIGKKVLENQLPLSHMILLLSGRASFELVQKAAMAGIKIIAAIGAPSSLAVELAKEFGITLAGFLREETANIYSEPQRILGA